MQRNFIQTTGICQILGKGLLVKDSGNGVDVQVFSDKD